MVILFAFMTGCTNVTEMMNPFTKAMNPDAALIQPRSYLTKTEDGWTLCITRINGNPDKKPRLPVVLCHGFGHNGFVWRANGYRSFSQFLARKGYDVWVPNLRGSGASSKAGVGVVRTMIKAPFAWLDQIPHIATDFNKINWTVDDYINLDIPATLKLIKKETGATSVNWVGHSMGGMIALVYMQEAGKAKGDINSIIALAAPLIIARPLNDLLKMLETNKNMFKIFNLLVNQEGPAMLHAAAGGNLQNKQDNLFYNTQNMSQFAIMEMLFYVIEDISPGCIDQFTAMVIAGKFKSADGKIDYSARTGQIEIPVYAVAGKADNLAEPETIRFLYNTISSKDKAFKMFGIASGARQDYGHTDLILGRRSPEEIFPSLEKWLSRHSDVSGTNAPASRPETP